MKKTYLFKTVITSPHNVKTMYLCSDKNKLKTLFNTDDYKDFKIGIIEKSNRYYATDSNKEIYTISLN